MNNLTVCIHLLKNGFLVKREKYGYCILIAALIVLLKIFSSHYKSKEGLIIVVMFSLTILALVLLWSSAFAPAFGKNSKEKNSFGASYLLSTVRFPAMIIVTNLIESLFDSVLIVAIFLLAFFSYFEKNDYHNFIELVVVFVTVAVFVRYMQLGSFGNVKGRIKDNDKKSKRYFFIFVLAGLFALSTKILNIALIQYLALPFLCSFLIGLIILVYVQIATDFNKKEYWRFNYLIFSLFTLPLIYPAISFYQDELKSGKIVFEYIQNNEPEEVLKILHENKQALNVRGPNTKLSPLLYSAKIDKLEMIKLLLANGANINEVDHYGQNLLFYTADKCNLEATEFLVKSGINYKQLSIIKQSPIFKAAKSNCLPLVYYFKKLGLSEEQKDTSNKNYIQYASSSDIESNRAFNFLIRNQLPY